MYFEKTQWFSGNVDPVHIGKYECVVSGPYGSDQKGAVEFRYWNGRHWQYIAGNQTYGEAYIMRWRGLVD